MITSHYFVYFIYFLNSWSHIHKNYHSTWSTFLYHLVIFNSSQFNTMLRWACLWRLHMFLCYCYHCIICRFMLNTEIGRYNCNTHYPLLLYVSGLWIWCRFIGLACCCSWCCCYAFGSACVLLCCAGLSFVCLVLCFCFGCLVAVYSSVLLALLSGVVLSVSIFAVQVLFLLLHLFGCCNFLLFNYITCFQKKKFLTSWQICTYYYHPYMHVQYYL